MLLDAKEKIAGFPILAVRNALKKLRNFGWGPESLSRYLKSSKEEARKLILALKDLGYIRLADPEHYPDSWEFTDEAGRSPGGQARSQSLRRGELRIPGACTAEPGVRKRERVVRAARPGHLVELNSWLDWFLQDDHDHRWGAAPEETPSLTGPGSGLCHNLAKVLDEPRGPRECFLLVLQLLLHLREQ